MTDAKCVSGEINSILPWKRNKLFKYLDFQLLNFSSKFQCCTEINEKHMVSYKIKDNRQRNLPPKIKVANEDQVRVRFNESWIEMIRVKHSRTSP
jgi:hypothetical protein